MQDRRVRQIKLRIAERRQDPKELLKSMKRLGRKPAARITAKGRKA